MLGKVSKKTSQEFSENIDYFTPQKSEYFRKKVLDSGNECIREIDTLIDTFDLHLNEKKLDNYVNNRKITKTRIFSGGSFVHTTNSPDTTDKKEG